MDQKTLEELEEIAVGVLCSMSSQRHCRYCGRRNTPLLQINTLVEICRGCLKDSKLIHVKKDVYLCLNGMAALFDPHF